MSETINPDLDDAIAEQTQRETMIRQAGLLAKLKDRFGVPDAELADWLDTHKTSISNLRRLDRPLTMRQELMIYDYLGYAWARNVILKLCPQDLAHILKVKDNLRSRKRRLRPGATL